MLHCKLCTLTGAAAKGRPKILLESTTAAGADRRDCVSDVTCATLQFVDLASPAQHSPPQAASGVGGVGDAARDSSQEVGSVRVLGGRFGRQEAFRLHSAYATNGR